MAKSLSARVALSVVGVLENSLDIGIARYPFEYGPNKSFTNGAGLNQASVVFSDTRTLAASANEDLDLNGTALQDALGANLALTKVKAIVVVADAANTNNVNVTRPASNGAPLFMAAGDGVSLPPGGMYVFVAPSAAGVAVTADTGDLVNIANSSGSTAVTYTIFILGA